MSRILALFWFWPARPCSKRSDVRGGPGRRFWRSIMVDFIGIERIQELVSRRGAARFIEELAREIESDFLRWSEFEKSARRGSHSGVGVIELMPASDGRLY